MSLAAKHHHLQAGNFRGKNVCFNQQLNCNIDFVYYASLVQNQKKKRYIFLFLFF